MRALNGARAVLLIEIEDGTRMAYEIDMSDGISISAQREWGGRSTRWFVERATLLHGVVWQGPMPDIPTPEIEQHRGEITP